MSGMVHIYTGDGKGKTTAALGLAMRAVGAGFRVAWIAFDKGGVGYSERKAIAERFKGEIDFVATGLDRRDRSTGRFRSGATPEDKAGAERGSASAREALLSGRYQLVVLDEIVAAAAIGLLTEAQVLGLIAARPPNVELVLTGRGATPAMIAAADLVSEIREVKHYFHRGVTAREGIDF